MSAIFTISLIAFTSFLAYWKTRNRRISDAASIKHAIRLFFEWVGASTIFFAVNLILGGTIILTIRILTQHFITVYDLDNPLLPMLSAAQGFIFHLRKPLPKSIGRQASHD